ncbi:MAG: Ig-like domain-containing protein, partial [Proteobacteria bacterium]|nr:Ig-like domain-containing protein [Pseudomonadota bacterium]
PTSPANNNLPTIGGTAEAGATVKLYTNAACTVPAATAGTGTATAGSAFSIPVTGGVIGDNTATTFYATATDAAGNASGCSMQNVAYTEDSAAPALPTLTSTTPASPSASSTTPTINGTSEANATVKVYTTPTCTGAPAGTATASAAGAFAVPATVSANSTTTFKATATDAAGNVSACSASSIVYTNDNQSPTPPTGLAVTPTGPANNNAPSVSGTAEASSTVNIYTNATCTSAVAGTGTASALGAFAITTTAPGDVTTTFYAKSIDGAGNASTCSTSTVSYVEDSTAPGLPAFTGTTPTSPSKTSTTPTINGTAEAGATVNLYTTAACGTIVATGTATGGTFAIGVTVTANTTTSYFAKAVDAAGNASACTTLSQTYAHDSVAPAAPVGVSLSPTGPVNNNAPSYVGTSEASATIKVYTNAACTTLSATGSASGAGAFAVPLSVGDNTTTTFYSTATDLAGNVSGCTAAGVTFVEDSTTPGTPIVTGTTPVSPSKANTTPTVNGTSEANATIDVYGNAACSGGKLGTGTATGVGTFAVSVTVTANTTTTLYALATDSASNVSACSTTSATYTHDNVAPATPGSLATTPASPSSNSTPTLSGTAETGSTVNVYNTNNCSGAIKGSTTAVAGAFSVSGTVALNATTSLTVQSVDAAGNLSACSVVLTYTHDSLAPATPTITASTPTGPSNVNTPVLSGTAETGSTVALYTTAGCSGAPTTGTAIAPGTFAISVTVADNSSTSFYARATDAAGNASGCSAAAFTYVEDSTPPPAPVLVSVSPTSPSTSTTPTITGTATASTQLKFFL